MNIKLCLYVVSAALAILLTGCASPARIEQMSVEGSPAQRIAQTPMRNNLAIKDVTGGKETNPMWKSNIGSSELEHALENSLRTVGLLAERQAGRFILTAHLENVEQPSFGFNLTVTATINYVVSERSTGKNLINRTLSVPYTAAFGDAFSATERMRLANEGAIRVNITQLIDELFLYKIEPVALR